MANDNGGSSPRVIGEGGAHHVLHVVPSRHYRDRSQHWLTWPDGHVAYLGFDINVPSLIRAYAQLSKRLQVSDRSPECRR